MRARAEFTAVLATQAVAAGAVLLIATRAWQTITTPRPRPFADDVLQVSGRTVDAVPTALALVALAGVVAVLATRGWARRAIGALVALAGAATAWRCVQAIGAVDAPRAAALVRDAHPAVVPTGASSTVVTHPVWGVVSIAAAVLVLAAGAMVAVRGGRWAALSARYETPAAQDEERERARADASLWTALDHGDDPTTRDPGQRA